MHKQPRPYVLRRWGVKDSTLSYDISFDAPSSNVLSIKLSDDAREFFLNGSSVPYNPLPYQVLHVERHRQLEGEDDLSWLSRCLHIDRGAVIGIAGLLRERNDRFLSGIEWVQEKRGGERVSVAMCKLKRGGCLSLMSLSSSERGCVLVEFALECAKFNARYAPVMLALELSDLVLRADGVPRYISYLSTPDAGFQVLITLVEGESIEALPGWQIYQINKTDDSKAEVKRYVVGSG